MDGKAMLLRYGGTDVAVIVGTTIRRDALYGRQSRSAEKNGRPLVKVVVDPEGNIFDKSAISPLQTDSQGSLPSPALIQGEDGSILEPQPSSFKVARELREAGLTELADLRVESVMPVECTLPIGVFQTEFTYRDAPVVKTAFLNVTPAGAFLLVGTRVETPLQGPTDLCTVFDPDDDGDEDGDGDGDDDDIPFAMF